MTTRAVRAAGLLVLALVAVACGGETSSGADDDGPVVWAHEAGSGDKLDAEVRGTVGYRSGPGCFTLTLERYTYPIVWPHQTTGVADGPGVELPDGTMARVGDSVLGGGGYLQRDAPKVEDFDIPAGCLPDTGEVAVFNPTGDVTVER